MMKSLKKLLYIYVVFLTVTLSITLNNNDSFASTAVKKTIMSNRKITLKNPKYSEQTTDTYSFSLDKKMALMIPFSFELQDKATYGSLKIILKNDQGDTIRSIKISLKGCDTFETYDDFDCSSETLLAKGKYRYILKNTSDSKVKVKYSVVGYTKVATAFTIKKEVSCRGGNWIKIGQFEKKELPRKVKVTFSNKKVTSDWWMKQNGEIHIWCESKGTSTVTIELSNGKRYKCEVTVKPGDPNFVAVLYDYNTRDNYFVVRIRNLSSHKLTIIRKGAEVRDVDYKTYDRSVSSTSDIVIDPGKTKKVKFYLNGNTTWYDYTDFTLYAKFKYEGVTYPWHVWDTDSVYKRNKSWYSTYWYDSDQGLFYGEMFD